ncbi:MAG: ATP-binding protein [Sulfurimonas sp.]|uniref:ATP-binding protein n=1 Tax=Sulfurimonas sp. TaxID=2022749 RepID=UPI0025FAD098|nr:ATP-binding protein [Sulfurimonas sp.]MCK9491001.1 ATP-binding protein [Sulfurimonas sp.]
MNSIETIKTYLTKNYRNLYDDSFSFCESLEQTQIKPTWLWIDEHLKTTTTKQDGGLIIDPEIGVCLFILPYNSQKLNTQIAKALNYRSKLLFEYLPESADVNGMWNIIVHWYVEEKDLSDWVKQVADIRRESAQIEEVPIDAIIYKQNEIENACVKHRFPRLLLQTRSILSKEKYDDIEKWSSANTKIKLAVQQAKKHLIDKFDEKLHQQIFNEIDVFIDKEEQTEETSEVSLRDTKTYQNISINNFRNINKLDIPLGDKNSITASIVHGPNGTGKSSIFEAFSFGLGNTSKRYRNYFDDNNHNRRNAYKKEYLFPINKKDSPTININAKNHPIDCEHDVHESSKRLNMISGTLLSQEQTGEFTKMPRSELGNIILGQSSTLAMALQEFITSRYSQVRETQKDYLRRYGINAQVRKIDTASHKVIGSYLNQVFTVPSSFLNWLSNHQLSEHPFFMAAQIFKSEWNDFSAQKVIYEKTIVSGSENQKQQIISKLLLNKGKLLSKNHEFYNSVNKYATRFDYDLIADIEKWSQWLQAQTSLANKDSSHITEIKIQRNEFSKQREKVIKNGQRLKARVEHIQTVQIFMDTHSWDEISPNECPTCGSDLTNRQGAHQAISLLFQQSQSEQNTLRDEYKTLSDKIKQLDLTLLSLGKMPNPLSSERQIELQEKLLWLIPNDISFSDYLSSESNTIFLKEIIQIVQLRQPINEKIYTEDEINAMSIDIAKKIEHEINSIKENFEQERAWTQVEKAINEEIMHIIDEHLPSTYQLLWMEIAEALTPAPWQYQGKVQLDADLKNKQSAVTVDIVGDDDGIQRLAHYILNGAEIHVLGLAWFFTRYLTFGRFQHAAIVLDDPAQEMDQHTFKDLCRFFEILVRLHRVKKIPLSFVVMLHQDERAVELVRMLNGWLHQLRWNHDGNVDMMTLKLMTDEFKAPFPNFLSIA